LADTQRVGHHDRLATESVEGDQVLIDVMALLTDRGLAPLISARELREACRACERLLWAIRVVPEYPPDRDDATTLTPLTPLRPLTRPLTPLRPLTPVRPLTAPADPAKVHLRVVGSTCDYDSAGDGGGCGHLGCGGKRPS
jgi:hypothetical protein